MTLEDFFTRLARDGSVPLEAWPEHEDMRAFGLVVDRDRVVQAADRDPLVEAEIRRSLSRRALAWLRRLEIRAAIGSTNAELMERARLRSIDGTVCTAEVQTQGRGRRGRTWSSAFGANLAISLGKNIDVSPSALGGMSLVVGLSVLDSLERLGVTDLSLKWPNDVLLGGAKLAGILIEMSRFHGTELVIGIGMNVTLPAQVRANLPREVADLSVMHPRPSRGVLAGRLISGVVEFVSEFETLGFEPFRAAFDARHAYRGRECRVIRGESSVVGIVSGVGGDGELILETADGVEAFHAGEVSLRGAS